MMIGNYHSSRICHSIVLKSILLHRFKGASSSAVVMKQKKSIRELLKEELPKPYDGPERDLINFPRRKRAVEPGKVRMGFIPDEWFQFFYRKTGVTGPYLFGGGLITYLLSKELFVITEEFSTGCAIFIILYTFNKKYGDKISDYAMGKVKEELQGFYDAKNANMGMLKDAVEEEKKNQWQYAGQKILMEAKRENIHMQLEAEYRKRLMTVYEQTKKRLDYQLELQNFKRRLEQKHMAEWIVNNVLKSISPQQEKEALQKCIQDLKMLSTSAH